MSVVNLEGPLTTAQNAKVKKFAFKGDQSYVNILKSGNIEAVTLANNHSEGYFEEAMKKTKFILDENDIKYFGLGEKDIVETNGIYQQTFNFEGNKLVSVDIPSVTPCSISSTNTRNDYKKTVLQGAEGERVLNKIKSISEELNK